jgi:hypothetical protein
MFWRARRILLGGAAALAALGAGMGARGEDAILTHEFFGKLGPDRAGLQLSVRDNEVIVAGHYFRQPDLVDIPVTAHVAGADVVLDGADGSVFTLHFIDESKPPKHLDPKTLTFYTSTGLAGRWTKDGRSSPVKFKGRWELYGIPTRLYDFTTISDAEYEAKVRRFQRDVLAGKRASAAAFVSYPLRVNGPGHAGRAIRDKRSLLAQWDRVFTPWLLKQLRDDIPHEMFTRNEMACLGGACDLWLDEKGVKAVNLP